MDHTNPLSAQPIESAPVATLVSILLVDNRPQNLVALEAALASLDCCLVTADSGEAALKSVLAQDFAVIVLDVRMPGMDGFETAGIIRARDRSHATPIIFLTADDRDMTSLMEGYRLGAVDYIFQPFDSEILRAKVAVFVELFRKTAELEQRTAELTLATAAMELATKHKSDFLTSMSHELRTPLNAIIGFSELMLDHDETRIPAEQRRTFLDHIQSSGQHLLGLVNDMLDLAKIEAGRMELSRKSINLQAALLGCVDFIRPMSDSKLLTVVVQCAPPEAVVSADPVRLNQILYNLLSNAVKFTPTGGQISVSAVVDATKAVIAVRDSGVGISPEDEALIFEPFGQVKTAGSSQHEGTGLGLSLARNLVELHGGRIWLADTAGAGSCFTFTLPDALDSAPSEAPASENAASREKVWSDRHA